MSADIYQIETDACGMVFAEEGAMAQLAIRHLVVV